MISLVPPVIGITILLSIGLLAAQSARETSVTEELARDLLRHHQHHYEVARVSGFPLGPVVSDLPDPLRPLAAWRSEVVQDGTRRRVLTWADGFGADGLDPSAYRAVVGALPERLGRGGVVGVITFPGTGGARIGTTDLPSTASPIAAGAPAIYR
jgi:hypothetical protein